MLHVELSDRDIEKLLAGQQPYGRPDLADVAHHFALLRSMSGFVAPPPMHPELVAQLHRAAVESSGQHPRLDIEPQPEPEFDEEPAASAASGDQARRRWRVVGAAAAAAMLAGVAYAGLLTSSKQGEGSPDTKTDRPPSAESTPSSSETTDPTPTSDEPPPATEAPAPPATEPPASTPKEDPADPQTDTGEAPANTPTPPAHFPWPEECQPGDWQCWVESFNRQPPPDGNGGRP